MLIGISDRLSSWFRSKKPLSIHIGTWSAIQPPEFLLWKNITLNELRPIDSLTIFDEIMDVMKTFDLDTKDLHNDPAIALQLLCLARKSWWSLCQNKCVLTIPVCSSHHTHLLGKVKHKYSVVQSIVDFLSSLSNFIDNSPKVRSILNQIDSLPDIQTFP